MTPERREEIFRIVQGGATSYVGIRGTRSQKPKNECVGHSRPGSFRWPWFTVARTASARKNGYRVCTQWHHVA